MKFYPNPEFLQVMPAEMRKKWAEALNSGIYEQGVDNLYCQGRYCCLGVFMAAVENTCDDDIDNCQTPVDALAESVLGSYISLCGGHASGNILIAVDEKGGDRYAAELNDDEKLSFGEIAKLVYPEGCEGEVCIERLL